MTLYIDYKQQKQHGAISAIFSSCLLAQFGLKGDKYKL
jgi:hypothetical protein